MIDSYVFLGDCFVQQQNFKQAIYSYQEAEELLIPSKNISKKCEIGINLGYCFQQLGDKKSFEKYRNHVFQLNTEMKWGTACVNKR